MKKTLSVLLLSCLCLCLVLSACGSAASNAVSAASTAPAAESTAPAPSSAAPASSAPAAPEHEPATLLVAAAASLEATYTGELIPLFQQQYNWISVEGTYDSSGKLQTQIEEGLAADVFMSAANTQMNALVGGGFVDESSVVQLLENEIVLIAPIDSDTAIDSFEAIADADTIALGDPESVPAGQYAQEALTSLGVYDAAAKASFGTNVTEVLNWVAEGSADVGIVYATDAAQMPDKVKIIATAPEGSLEKPVIYPVGILAENPQRREAADLFVEFLQSPEAMAIFEAAGFITVSQMVG